MKAVIIVDVQNDFVSGSLGSPASQKIIPKVQKVIETYVDANTVLIATQDEHAPEEFYLQTFEGKKLPISHCVVETWGWELESTIKEAIEKYKDKYFQWNWPLYLRNENCISKNTFGSLDLINMLYWLANGEEEEGWTTQDYINAPKYEDREFEEIIICGLCTDICVVSNALLLRAAFPNTKITIIENACAGVTSELHDAAIATMISCQIDIKKI
jgi:nicotinamidase-related amidase